DPLATHKLANTGRIAGACEGGDGRLGNALEPGFLIPEQVRQRAADKEMEPMRRIFCDERVLVLDRLAQLVSVWHRDPSGDSGPAGESHYQSQLPWA